MLKQDVIHHYTREVAHAGGTLKLAGVPAVAHALGLTRQAVYAWPHVVPERYAARLDRLTNGALAYRLEDYVASDDEGAA